MVDAPGLPQDPLQVRLWPFLQLARRFEVNRITKPVDATPIGQTALFREHCRAVAVELQEGLFAETNSVVAQISGRPPMTIEEFVAKNRAAFI